MEGKFVIEVDAKSSLSLSHGCQGLHRRDSRDDSRRPDERPDYTPQHGAEDTGRGVE